MIYLVSIGTIVGKGHFDDMARGDFANRLSEIRRVGNHAKFPCLKDAMWKIVLRLAMGLANMLKKLGTANLSAFSVLNLLFPSRLIQLKKMASFTLLNLDIHKLP